MSDRIDNLSVQLRYAGLPLIGFIAVHYWFVVSHPAAVQRWEVWQTKNAGGRSIGHVHCDLKRPDEGVGGGPPRLAGEWSGADAQAIKRVLDCAGAYPHCWRYRPWPGPNSNTFVAWVLREAGIRHRLGWRALGCRYRC